MSRQFLSRGEIVDIVRSRDRTNSIRKREGLSDHPVSFTVCGCPDPNCGGWHTIVMDRTVPTPADCEARLREDKKARRVAKRRRG